jgi:hypothetical protein
MSNRPVANLLVKSFDSIFGKDFWERFLGKIFGKDFFGKQVLPKRL